MGGEYLCSMSILRDPAENYIQLKMKKRNDDKEI